MAIVIIKTSADEPRKETKKIPSAFSDRVAKTLKRKPHLGNMPKTCGRNLCALGRSPRSPMMSDEMLAEHGYGKKE